MPAVFSEFQSEDTETDLRDDEHEAGDRQSYHELGVETGAVDRRHLGKPPAALGEKPDGEDGQRDEEHQQQHALQGEAGAPGFFRFHDSFP